MTVEVSQQLREARLQSGLSQQELARRAGLSLRTILNIEMGSHVPSADTMARLLRVPALQWEPTRERQAFAPGYDPMGQTEDMIGFFAGPGGAQDQSWLYLEPQGAIDFRRYCGDPLFAIHYRDPLPLPQVTSAIIERSAPWGVDVLALGPGDGVVETRFCAYLVEKLPHVNLDLLDCSHGLLSVAFRHAADSLSRYGVKVHPIHGDFYKLLDYESITYRAPTDHRRRVWTLFGHTIGNLRDELDFFVKLAQVSRPGDFLIFDYQLEREPDALLTGKVPPQVARWVTGPLRRNLNLGESLPEIKTSKVTRCPVPGSYAVEISCEVDRGKGKRFACKLAQVKRYEPQALADALLTIGWRAVQQHKYGPDPQLCGLLLCERAPTERELP